MPLNLRHVKSCPATPNAHQGLGKNQRKPSSVIMGIDIYAGDQYYKNMTVIGKYMAQSPQIGICHACSSLASTSGSTGAKGAGTLPLPGATVGPGPVPEKR